MKIFISGLIASLLFFKVAIAQIPIISGDIIASGIRLHDEGKYKEAIAMYKQVPVNDTNYAKALYELSYSYILDSNFTAAIKVCEEGLQLESNDYEFDFLQNYGSAVDNNGN